jgi:predicted nuclease of restriction endonuclease-like (RecB) superfamily
MNQDIGMYEISNTDDIFKDAQNIVEQTRNYAYQAVNIAMIQRNWLLGKRIADEELQGENRAEYGKEVINRLANHLTNLYGKGFSKSNLYQFVQFYKYFPDIFHSLSGKSFTLSWTHYRTLLRVTDKKAREWYLQESEDEMWSVRTLDRNIASQYYYRLLQSQNKQEVKDEMKDITTPLQQDNLEFIKNPVVAEFLGLSPNADFSETKLESSIISHIQKFVMELGKGYAFVARQQHIKTDVGDYFIDLVFYNYILKCFLLIDLKTSRITHQDVGQMDMYVRMYDNLKRTEGDNPTIGLILCSETSKDMARYSVLHDNERLFQARYLTFLPSIEQLKEEIELQKEIFQLQQSNDAPTKQ